MITSRLDGQTFAGLWAAIHIIGWGVAALLVTLGLLPADWGTWIVLLMLTGGIITAAQYSLFQYALGDTPSQWISRSLLGYLGGAWFYASLQPGTAFIDYLAFGGVFIAPALVQWWSLREGIPAHWVWLIAQSVVALLAVGLLLLPLPLWIIYIGIGILHGGISAVAMWWMLRDAHLLIP